MSRHGTREPQRRSRNTRLHMQHVQRKGLRGIGCISCPMHSTGFLSRASTTECYYHIADVWSRLHRPSHPGSRTWISRRKLWRPRTIFGSWTGGGGQQVPKLCVNGQRPRRAREAQFGHFQGCILYSIPAQGLALLNVFLDVGPSRASNISVRVVHGESVLIRFLSETSAFAQSQSWPKFVSKHGDSERLSL